MHRILYILLLLLTHWIVKAQIQEKKIPNQNFKFGIGGDVLKAFTVFVNPNEENDIGTRFEVNSCIIYKKQFFLKLDVGFAQKNNIKFDSTLHYFSEGFYTKLGIDYCFYERKVFYINFGYKIGSSFYTYKKHFLLYDSDWQEPYIHKTKNNQTFYFTEISFPFGFKLSSHENGERKITLGFIPSARIAYRNANHIVSNTYFIPGYGGNDRLVLALNIQLMYHFK